ncbi:hypothetical protein KU6B_47600 [Mameliella alba]|uniref:hypothetical protein n=1 Tax=Mameliella alba TaxID=561184 RepID=UPI0013E4F69B|nr:hypothetical protein [Mameliella alba]BBU58495.1 hypothetical protein KU6B_47600 [Mameliella alba]
MTNVYAFPPVSVTGWEWDVQDPVNVSRSLLDGGRYVTTSSPRRIVARARVSALGLNRSGAGYMQALRRLLNGGEHLVRISSWPVNYWLDDLQLSALRGGVQITWEDSGTGITWVDVGSGITWIDGAYITGTTGTDSDGFATIALSGLPASTLCVRPGDFLTIYDAGADTTGETIMVMSEGVTDASGDVTVRLIEAPSTSYSGNRVSIGTSETAAFEVTEFEPFSQSYMGDWSATWSYRQVFSDEVPDGFTEVNPWS